MLSRFRDILDNTYSIIQLGLGTENHSAEKTQNGFLYSAEERIFIPRHSDAHGRVNSDAQFAVELTHPGAKNNAVEHNKRPREAEIV
jgi:hypothetical protein